MSKSGVHRGFVKLILIQNFFFCYVIYLHAGKLMPKTEEKTSSGNKKTEDETSVSQVDQIKMKYGYANATNDVSAYNSFAQITRIE
jgi:ribosomal protein S24E